jgi:transcriptional regulator with XRE-family HTH domain
MNDTTFGQFIIQLREAKSMSQRKLAEAASVTNSTISRIEANLVQPDPLTLDKLAKALDADKSLLLTKCGYSEIPEEFVVIARKVGEMPKEHRARIYKTFNDTIDDFLKSRD